MFDDKRTMSFGLKVDKKSEYKIEAASNNNENDSNEETNATI